MSVRHTHLVRERQTSSPQAVVPHETELRCLPPVIFADNVFLAPASKAHFSTKEYLHEEDGTRHLFSDVHTRRAKLHADRPLLI